MKKLVSIITAILMVTSLTTKSFALNDTFTDLDLTYTVIDEVSQTVSVSSTTTSITTCQIPETITNNGKQYTVTKIQDKAFEKCHDLRSISIPDTIDAIGAYAFLECDQLLEVQIPESVTSIGRNAFSGCKSLHTVNIPKGVTILNEDTFHTCTSLKSITLPEGIQVIKDNVFISCPLTTVVIPSSVEEIHDSVFQNCQKLETMILPNTIQTLATNAFLNCANLSNVIVISNENNKTVSSVIEDGILKHPNMPTCYLGLTNMEAKQSTVETQSNKTLDLRTFFTVTSKATDKQGMETTLPVPIPQSFLQPSYTLTGTVEGKTRVENNQLRIDPKQTHDFSVEGILNNEKATVTIAVKQSPIIAIEVHQQPLKVSYSEGETFDPTGLQLKIIYENNTSEIVSYDQNTRNNFQFSTNIPLTMSDKQVGITYANHLVEQAISVQRKPIIVSSDQNAIIGLAANYVQGNVLQVEVKGAGMDRQSPMKGDTRYHPVNWKILKEENFKDDKYQILMNTELLEIGKQNLLVTYHKEEYDGQKWVFQEITQQVETFEVTEKITPDINPKPDKPVIIPPEDLPFPKPDKPVIIPPEILPITKPDTPVQVLPDAKLEESKKTTPIQTGDSTFIMGFVVLVVVSGGILVFLFKKKRNDK